MTVSRIAAAVLAVLALTAPAFAHTPEGSLAGGFAEGLAHAFGGLDHVLALAAIGLWAAWLGGRSLRARPFALISAGLLAGFALVHGLGHGSAAPLFVLGLVAASGILIGLGFAAARAAEKLRPPRAQAFARSPREGRIIMVARGFARAGAVALAAAGILLLVP